MRDPTIKFDWIAFSILLASAGCCLTPVTVVAPSSVGSTNGGTAAAGGSSSIAAAASSSGGSAAGTTTGGSTTGGSTTGIACFIAGQACPNGTNCCVGLTCDETFHCEPDTTGTGSGTTGGSCTINGAVYPARASNPANPGECCNPALNPSTWQPLFTKLISFPAGGGNIAASNDGAVGDLNGDGIDDVALTAYVIDNNNQSEVWIYLSGPAGFSGPTVYAGAEPGDYYPGDVTLGDLNGDGRPDLLVSTAQSLDLYTNFGGGAFGSETYVGDGCLGGYIQLIDVNGDGVTDAVQDSSCGILVYLNAGDGGWSLSGTSYPSAQYGDLAVGDFNGDGYPDLAFDDNIGGVSILAGSAHGLTTVTSVYAPFYGRLASLPVEGGAMLVGVSGSEAFVFGFNGNQTVSYPLDLGVTPVTLSDVNRDGYLDILASDGTSIAVLLNAGNGTFGRTGVAQVPNPDGAGIQQLKGADLLGNGTQDLVIFRANGPWEGWINTCAPGAAELILDGG